MSKAFEKRSARFRVHSAVLASVGAHLGCSDPCYRSTMLAVFSGATISVLAGHDVMMLDIRTHRSDQQEGGHLMKHAYLIAAACDASALVPGLGASLASSLSGASRPATSPAASQPSTKPERLPALVEK